MFWAGENFEAFQAQGAEGVFGKHPGNRRGNDSVGVKLHLLFERALPKTAGVAGMPAVHFLLGFAAGDFNFGGVLDNYVVAAIKVGRKIRLMLTYQQAGNFDGGAAQDLAVNVDEMPAADNGFGGKSFTFHNQPTLGGRDGRGRRGGYRYESGG